MTINDSFAQLCNLNRFEDPYAAAPSVLSQSGFCSSAVTGFMLTASEPRFSASVLSACVTSAGADQL